MKTEDEVQIRRLRKKLRQIENLERLDRPLSVEEQLKVNLHVIVKRKNTDSL